MCQFIGDDDICINAATFLHRSDFNWLKTMRYCWISSSESMQVRMLTTFSPYFYEYMGVEDVLVNTPMTDRAYISLLLALESGGIFIFISNNHNLGNLRKIMLSL